MNKEQVLKDINATDIKLDENLNNWLFNINGKPYKIRDYVLSNVMLNSSDIKSDLVARIKTN